MAPNVTATPRVRVVAPGTAYLEASLDYDKVARSMSAYQVDRRADT
jgi:hypothetical protein